MAKRKTDALPYDGEKLRYQIESHNWIQAALSEDMGFAKGYLNRFCNHMFDEIPRRTTLLLESYGIHYEDYKPDPEPEPTPEPQDDPLPWDIANFEERLLSAPSTVVLSGESITELCRAMHDVIYDAVYSAVKKAWSE